MSNHPKFTWSQVKERLDLMEKRELLRLLRDLFELNVDNKFFLAARVFTDSPDVVVEPYRRVIRQVFNPEQGLPSLELRKARKALSDFQKTGAPPLATIDLMIFYVEQGLICTLSYGDIDEAFYTSLESVFALAAQAVNRLDEPALAEEMRPRFTNIVRKSSGTGWGFHDTLQEIYYSEFSDADAD
jgi:hypothetical protein